MVLTLNTHIHMHVPRRHFTCPFTDLLYVNKRTAIHDSNIYTCNRGTFCPRAHRQNKDHIKPDQLSNHMLLGKPNGDDVKGMRSFVLS